MPRPGELWLAAIPFTTGVAAKIRPVLILWEDAADVVVATVTSVSPRSVSDVSLLHWQAEGLRVPSTVRLSRIDCLEQATLLRRLGVLASEDAQRVKEAWAVSSQLRF